MTTSMSAPRSDREPPAVDDAPGVEDVVPVALPPMDAAATADRDNRFLQGIRTLRVGRASVKLEERMLMVIGGILAPLGLIVVLLGWWGAAHTPYVFDQLPYLISGGLLGLGLVFLGAFFYFAHWMTQLVKEQRAQSTAVLEALERLQAKVAEQGGATVVAPAPASSNGAEPTAAPLVATERGSMAHRPDCVVVTGKDGLRAVTEADGLAPCKLCEPYG